MAICKIETAGTWAESFKTILPVKNSQPSHFDNYIKYHQQHPQVKQPVTDFKTVLENAMIK